MSKKMSKKEIMFIISTVEKINNKMFKNMNHDFVSSFENYGNFFLSYTYCGCEHFVTFCDLVLWNSVEENREFIGEIGDYEPLEDFLIREINRTTSFVSLLKLKE